MLGTVITNTLCKILDVEFATLTIFARWQSAYSIEDAGRILRRGSFANRASKEGSTQAATKLFTGDVSFTDCAF